MKQKRKWEITHILSSMALKILIFIFIIFLLFTVFFRWVRYSENSMNPAIKAGDLILIDKWNKNIQLHDLVAVKSSGKIIVRRVIALGGDIVEINEEGVFVNGVLQSESYAQGETKLYRGGFSGRVKLAGDEIFLLADMREGSEDSRSFGPIRKNSCLGRVAFFLRQRNF